MHNHDMREKADVVVEGGPDCYVPACPVCQQPGRDRASGFSERQFICASCGARWIVRPALTD